MSLVARYVFSIFIIVCLTIVLFGWQIIRLIRAAPEGKQRNRRIAAAVLPLLVLLLLWTDQVFAWFNANVPWKSLAFRFIAGLTTGAVIVWLGGKMRKPSDQAWDRGYVLLLASVIAFLLCTIIRGTTEHLHLFLFTMGLVVSLTLIFERP